MKHRKPKEIPIMFKAEMVRALLERRKTQTRRTIPVQPLFDEEQRLWHVLYPWGDGGHGIYESEEEMRAEYDPLILARGPQAGDRLWVKETYSQPGGELVYRATDPDNRSVWHWRPCMFMPRDLSRIMLEVSAVRVERLQAITEDDAKAEGVDNGPGRGAHLYPSPRAARGPLGYRGVYRELWNKINGPLSWTSNELVRVITFAPLEAGAVAA